MFAIIGCVATATPAIADIASFSGMRCTPNETISVDEYGMGFNENTVCDFAAPPTFKSGTMRAQLNCANIYVTDMSTDPVTVVETDQRSFVALLKPANDIDLDVFFDGELVGRYGACG